MDVTIYSTPTCSFCKALKDFLTSKNVDYTAVDITESTENLEEMKKYSGGAMSVPVMVINKDQDDQQVQIGYDQEKVSQALNLN